MGQTEFERDKKRRAATEGETTRGGKTERERERERMTLTLSWPLLAVSMLGWLALYTFSVVKPIMRRFEK